MSYVHVYMLSAVGGGGGGVCLLLGLGSRISPRRICLEMAGKCEWSGIVVVLSRLVTIPEAVTVAGEV